MSVISFVTVLTISWWVISNECPCDVGRYNPAFKIASVWNFLCQLNSSSDYSTFCKFFFKPRTNETGNLKIQEQSASTQNLQCYWG